MFQKIKQKIEDGRLHELWEEIMWVWRYICRYRITVLIHILIGIIGIVMMLFSSVASKFLIDAVISYDSGVMGYAAALMIGMRTGNIIMKSVASRIGAVLNIRIQNEVQAEVYNRILVTDWQELNNFRNGDLLNRISSDTNTVSGGITGFVPSVISNFVQLAGAFIIIFHYDWVMALIALLTAPLTMLISTAFLEKMRWHNKKMKESQADVLSFQQDSFQNITTIKSFGVADWFGKEMLEVQRSYREKYLEYNKFSVKTSAIMGFVSLATYIGCFGWGVYRLWMGRITYGEMTMFLQLAGLIGGAFSAITNLVPAAISIATSAGRIMAVTQLPAENVTPEEGFDREEQYTISLKDVNFRYNEGEPVLKGVNLEAGPGEIIAVTGPSGEGKTTLLRIMLGLVKPTEGKAVVVGADAGEYAISAATRRIFSYVPQGNQIFSGTIADNLRITCPDATVQQLEEALKIACAYDFVSALPEGINHIVGGRDKRLSEGQAQRIALARALLKKAPVLLLDEATSALDMETEAQLLKNLMESGIVKTCILVTHRPALKELCNRRYHIRDGIVMEEA